jgi:predicted enzyme related to lactoylglutathione lyase
MLRRGGREVAILYQQPEARAAGAPPHWTSYISVEDADAVAARASELATTDIERAKSFYGKLLGWEYETDESRYVSITNAGRLNGAMREQTEQERRVPPAWFPHLTVRSADEAARHAVQLGGHALVPTKQSRRGRHAVISDPQGAAFAVFEGETDR